MRDPEKQTMTEVIALMHDQPFGVSRDIIRNVQTLSRRFANEGFSFLTKTLPSIGKRFDSALSGHEAFNTIGLLKMIHGTCIPHLLGSALRRIFNDDGRLKPEPCTDTIRWLRTVFFYAYKIEVPFSDDLISKFTENFIEVDSSLGSILPDVPPQLINRMRHLLAELDSYRNHNPAHGPGVSSNTSRVKKYDQFVHPSPLRSHFGRNFFHQSHDLFEYEVFTSYLFAFLAAFSGVIYCAEGFSPSKVLFVPKDSRGPRTICCEDSRLMWAQKSLQKALYQGVESSRIFGGRVNFTDQSINQRKTFDKRFATLDLKEASDRVDFDLVMATMPPKIAHEMQLCRSPFAQLPDGNVVPLKKFAPMGSALCFPVMALIAFTSVVSYVSMKHGVPTRDVEVYVYGDDIIIPNEYAASAIVALNLVGLKVNEGKSFVNSRFTESCGTDAFEKVSVTPIRKKKLSSKGVYSRYRGKRIYRDDGFTPHYVSLGNSALKYGYKNLYESLRDCVEKSLPRGYCIPFGVPESPYLNWHVDPKDVYVYNRAAGYDRNGMLRAITVKDEVDTIDIRPEQRLLRDLLEGGGEKPLDPTKIGARRSFMLKRNFTRWGTSYY